MGPEFNEKMQWARYLQLQHDEERRREKARMARIEEELKKEKENKDIEEKYMNYEFEEKTEEKVEEPKDDKSLGLLGEVLAVAFTLLFFGSIFGILCWILVKNYGG